MENNDLQNPEASAVVPEPSQSPIIPKAEKREILFHLIDIVFAFLYGMGTSVLTSGSFGIRGVIIGGIGASIVAVVKFREYLKLKEDGLSKIALFFI